MILKKLACVIGAIIGMTLLYNEFLVYYIVLFQCRWPSKLDNSVRAMLLADTHLLGPFKGHWLDKFYREWQMQRVFQASIRLHRPDVVFILGDVFDEGQWVDEEQFQTYLLRFYRLFQTPSHIKVYSVVGNHDIGFHYRLHPYVVNRFKNAFNESNNSLITIKDTHFVLLNSMTLSRDGCYFCAESESQILRISKRLSCAKKDNNSSSCKTIKDKLDFYAKPVILQHFPTFRKSDAICEEYDSPIIENYRENWEVLSKEATNFLGKTLEPLVAFSGHSHHYCRSHNMWNVEEFTIASFSWRNKENPSFLLAEFSKNKYAIAKCDMPNENTVFLIYLSSGVFILTTIIIFAVLECRSKRWIKKKN